MATITFGGSKFSYNEKALSKYSVIKAFSQYEANPAGVFDAFSELFNGRDDEYAEKLGGDMGKVMELVAAIMDKAGESAKN